MQFMIKKIENFDTIDELENVGFDASYREFGAKKQEFMSFKIFSLTPQQATILKQSAISIGSDCAIHRHVIDFKIEKTDCLITASISQFEKLAEKLKKQPFSLKKLAENILEQIKLYKQPKKSIIMGILNVNENSFSDGGNYLNEEVALNHASKMIKDGAKIIDIGAESTAPFAATLDVEVEIERLVPVIEKIKKNHPEILISVDTRNAKAARAAILAGADIINDVSFLNYDPELLNVALEYQKPLIITHSRGTPLNMNDFAQYKNVVEEVYFELKNKCDFAIKKGMEPENIIIDMGFGFAKDEKQNLELLKHIVEFKSLGYKILAGVSRKRFLAPFSDPKNPKNRDEITSTASFYLALKGIDIIRVHNVELNVAAINFAQQLL